MANRLRKLRRATGLSQFQPAVKANASLDALGKWQKGTRTPVPRTAAQLAQALGGTVGQLAGTGPMPAPPGKKGKR
jgi:transcriptional regulator with XRE-family HTH domain